LLLLSITGIYSTFKLNVDVTPGGPYAASDAPTEKDTWNVLETAIDADSTCVDLDVDPAVLSDYLYKECLDTNCVKADLDWAAIEDFDKIPLTIIACYKTCSPIATAGNAKIHAACVKVGLTAAGVQDTKLMMDYVVLGPVSLYYADSMMITETTPLKFNTYGRYMRDVAKSCLTHAAELWEST